MNRFWRQHGYPGILVFAVVPAKECATELFGVLNTAKAFGKFRAALQGLEMGFRVRIIVAHMRAAVGFGDTQLRQQLWQLKLAVRQWQLAVEQEQRLADVLA